jgi:hypothetical protein
VIYAIEEPETSQHPDHQERIVQALSQVAAAGDQVLLTTHVPALAGLLPVESIRFVDSDPETGAPRVRPGSAEVLAEVAETLGIVPEAAETPNVRVAVLVEGFTDIDALVSFADALSKAGKFEHIDHSRIFWTIGGGQTLKDWVERRYLDRLGLPQVFIFDSDRTNPGQPIPADKEARLVDLNGRPNCIAFMARKREIENYMHPTALERLSEGRIALREGIDLDFTDLPARLGEAMKAAREAHGSKLGFYPDDHQGRKLGIGTGDSNCKKIITAYIMRNMTAEEILERGVYVDPETGAQRNEILEWMEAIRQHLN